MNYQHTSAEAWKNFQPHSHTLDSLILQAIKDEGRITCERIEELIDRSHQAVSGNLRHLVEDGYVRASGEYGKTKTGRKAILWELV